METRVKEISFYLMSLRRLAREFWLFKHALLTSGLDSELAHVHTCSRVGALCPLSEVNGREAAAS